MKDTILIVDDEKILDLMNKMLSKKHSTLTAKDGQEGLKIFNENKDRIKLVITDEMMPKMTGSEMVEQIVNEKPGMPIIFVTGKNEVNYRGGHHIIRKPFNIIDLVNTVKTVMDSYQTGSGQHTKIG
ncbi:MAG: response regulator [Candidatus Lokiarchaeota archaeon]|nr:response regulator [Candidatus Lokiarchaeota archaeon]